MQRGGCLFFYAILTEFSHGNKLSHTILTEGVICFAYSKKIIMLIYVALFLNLDIILFMLFRGGEIFHLCLE